MSHENVEIVRGLLAAIAEERFDDVVPSLHPELEIVPSTEFPESEVLRGSAGFRLWESRWPEMFEEYEFTPTDFWDAGDQVVVALHERGRSERGGTSIDAHFAHVWTIRDGAVVRIQVFDASAEALEAAGLRE
jgi:uncharacterized protein